MKIRLIVIANAVAIVSIAIWSISWRVLYQYRKRVDTFNPSLVQLQHWWSRLEYFGAVCFVVVLFLILAVFRKHLDLRGTVATISLLFTSCFLLTVSLILGDPVAAAKLREIGLNGCVAISLGIVAGLMLICSLVVMFMTVDDVSGKKLRPK